MNNRILEVLGILAVSILLGAGVWFWMGFIAGGADPKISNFTVAPEAFRFTGGEMLVQAEVTDDQSVELVAGVLSSSGIEVMRVELQLIGTEAGDSVYSGKLMVPTNIRNDGNAIDYTLRLLAMNTEGGESKKETAFQVPAPSMPPAPPD